MEGSFKLNPVFSRGQTFARHCNLSRKASIITPGVINKQTVSKPWQSSTFNWLAGRLNKGPTRFYYFDLPDNPFSSKKWNDCGNQKENLYLTFLHAWLVLGLLVAVRKFITIWPTPIQTSYFIGPCNLHYLLFSGIGALLCHHPHCFPSQSQTLFGMGAGWPPITAIARWLFQCKNTFDFAGGRGGGLTSLF